MCLTQTVDWKYGGYIDVKDQLFGSESDAAEMMRRHGGLHCDT
jgi:hypothetical protein